MEKLNNIFSQKEKYEFINKLVEELRIRKYSLQTEKSYLSIIQVSGVR